MQPANATNLSGTTADQLRAAIEAQAQSTLLQAFASPDATDATTGTSTQTQPFADLMHALLAANVAPGGSDPTAATATGLQIAGTASSLVGDLRGAWLRSFDPAVTPQAATQAWETPGWGNGNVQCVGFVDGVYRQAGKPLPVIANATEMFGAYQHQPGWVTVANGQGLPQPGDIIAMSGGSGGMGHVAIVTAVQPPQGNQPGYVIFAQSNAGTRYGTLAIDAANHVAAWPGYAVQGFIRPQPSPAQAS